MRRLLVLTIWLAIASTSYAAIICLTNGQVINGTIRSRDDKTMLVETKKNWQRIQFSDIQYIDRDDDLSGKEVKNLDARDGGQSSIKHSDIRNTDKSEDLYRSRLINDERNDSYQDQRNQSYRQRDYSRVERNESDETQIKRSYQKRADAGSTWQPDREILLKLAYDFPGKFEAPTTVTSSIGNTSGSASHDTDTGVSFAYEYVGYSENGGIGVGINYQNPRGIAKNVSGSFHSVPIYLIGRLRTTPETADRAYFYMTGHVGFNMFYGDDELRLVGFYKNTFQNGIYYAGGVGAIVNHFNVELLYSVNNGRMRESGTVYDSIRHMYIDYTATSNISYKKLGLFVGYNF